MAMNPATFRISRSLSAITFAATLTVVAATTISLAEPEAVWPDLAPGETTRHQGEVQAFRANENPPVTRVTKITQPTFTVHLPEKPTGTGVVILPGGGFGKVVPDKEGTEAAAWLNRHGIAAFVLSYRTKSDGDMGWEKPLQDAQRTLALVRSRARQWGLRRERIGLLGFSAGGQVAARLLAAKGQLSYDQVDDHDEISHWPNFAMLVYPWNLYDHTTSAFVDGVRVPDRCPPTFIVHTDDDRSSSLGAVLFYTGLKQEGIPAELHVYGNGGHGYGLRPVEGSQISSWPEHGAHWLKRWMAQADHQLLETPER